jgi:hypothetical protein
MGQALHPGQTGRSEIISALSAALPKAHGNAPGDCGRGRDRNSMEIADDLGQRFLDDYFRVPTNGESGWLGGRGWERF